MLRIYLYYIKKNKKKLTLTSTYNVQILKPFSEIFNNLEEASQSTNSAVITQFIAAKISRFKWLLVSQSRSFPYKPLQAFNI